MNKLYKIIKINLKQNKQIKQNDKIYNKQQIIKYFYLTIIMDTHLQRDTQTLLFNRRQIQDLHEIAIMINKGIFIKAQKYLQDFVMELPNKKYNAFQLELKYQHILVQIFQVQDNTKVNKNDNIGKKFQSKFNQLLKQINLHQENYKLQEKELHWPQAGDLRYRIYVSLNQLWIKYDKINNQQYLEQLTKILKATPSLLPQTFGRLIGLKNPQKFLRTFNKSSILCLPSTIQQRSKQLQICSDWLMILNQYQRAIQCKQIALEMWGKANQLGQYKACQKELGQMRQNNGDVFNRLKRARIIVGHIMKQIQKIQVSKSKIAKDIFNQPQISLIVENSMTKTLNSIQQFNESLQNMKQTAKKEGIKKSFFKSSTLSSSLKKSLIKQQTNLNDNYLKAKQFLTEIYKKQKNQQITCLLRQKSKFIVQQRNIFSQVLKPLIKQFTIRQHYAFHKIFTLYKIKKGLLNPQFMSSQKSPSSSIQAKSFLTKTQLTKKQYTSQIKPASSSQQPIISMTQSVWIKQPQSKQPILKNKKSNYLSPSKSIKVKQSRLLQVDDSDQSMIHQNSKKQVYFTPYHNIIQMDFQRLKQSANHSVLKK